MIKQNQVCCALLKIDEGGVNKLNELQEIVESI